MADQIHIVQAPIILYIHIRRTFLNQLRALKNKHMKLSKPRYQLEEAKKLA